ncbi:MAG: DUF4421 family protein [Bacteroidales bacterium]|nr:DUF4421 family protein [Bacteroidales bacterium]
MRRVAAISLAIVFSVASLSAQDDRPRMPEGIVGRVFSSLTRPHPKKDTAYILRSPLPWSFSLDNTLITTGAKLHSDITVTEYQSLNQALMEASTVRATFENRLQRHLHKKAGLSVGYGSLRISGGLEIGAKNPGKNSFLSLSLRRPTFGATVRFIRLQEYLEGNLAVEGVPPQTFISDYPGIMRTMTGDVYYLFNGHRFDYNATQGCNVDQRRSSGSLMTLAKYLQGDLLMDRRDQFMLAVTEGLYSYTTQQVSLGIGYSYNWVTFHRDSDDRKNWKGYRNLTFNFTAIPMASVYNHMYSLEELGDGQINKTKLNGTIVPTYTFRSGLSFSWSRYSLVGTVVYNRFGFDGMHTTIWRDNNHLKNDLKTKCAFDDLTAKMRLVVRL